MREASLDPEPRKELRAQAAQERREWAKHHYGAVARWIKEVALLFLASLVVQKLITGGSVIDPVVLLGVVVSLTLYACAVYLLLKS